MSAAPHHPERAEAARLAFALLRFSTDAAAPFFGHTPPGPPRLGLDALLFVPSWSPTPLDTVEQFLIDLPSPALFSTTLTRGVFSLLLLDELSGDRRRWAEKTFSNQVALLDDAAGQLGLEASSRVLVEYEEESLVFSLATVRYWAGQMAIDLGWNLGRLTEEPRADACMMLIRPDGKQFRGRSSHRLRWKTA